MLEGLKGIIIIADDDTLYGVGDTLSEAMVDHNQKLRALLHRCRINNVKM